MTNSNDIRPLNDTVVFLSDLKDGEKFKVPSMALPSGYMRTFIYKQHIKVKTLVFHEENGNGELKLPETAQFNLKVERA